MNKRILLLVSSIVIILGVSAGYALTTNFSDTSVANARSNEMPEQIYIVALAPININRGALDQDALQQNGAIRFDQWSALQAESKDKPIDALIVDAPYFDSISDSEKRWLQDQF